MRVRHIAPLLLYTLIGLALIGCRPAIGGRQIVIRADGKDIPLFTTVLTVREALAEGEVSIDRDDRVDPDLWVELEDGMTIRVIRVQQEIIVEREAMAYKEQTIKSEALGAGEKKLLQAGKNGQVEVTYRLQFEDGVEVSRSVLRQVVTLEPVNQITVVGVEGLVGSVQIEGTIAYLNSGNAWIMRGASGGRHPVTSEGDLDGHVFALSPDGAYLLYSVSTNTVEFDGPFNDLYLLNVAVVDEEPQRLPIQNVLWADWSPNGSPSGSLSGSPSDRSHDAPNASSAICGQIAYSTGEKSGPPGWKAKNDLWTASLLSNEGQVIEPELERILGPQTSGAYSWWGSQYAWSPDGRKVAYARPDQVGWIDIETRQTFPLAPFSPLNTHREQVWVPMPAWSPDSQYIACTIHGEEPGQPAEESQVFEIWALDLTHTIRARLTRSVGMWSLPRWGPSQEGESLIAYAEANTPSSSYESRYALKAMDRDGSNKRILFPVGGQVGMAHPLAYDWSPGGHKLLVLYLGNLHLVDVVSGQTQQLTGDGQSTRLDWAD